MTEIKWTIRKMAPNDGKRILDLFNRVFENELTYDYWEWQYLSNPTSGPIAWVAQMPDGEIVGHYSLIPVPFWRDGKVENAGYSIHSMVKKDYQRQGMLKALSSAAEEQLNDDRIETGLTYLNENSFPVYTKSLGWTKMDGELSVYWTVINSRVAFRDIIKNRFLSGLCGVIAAPILKLYFRSKTTSSPISLKEVERFDHRIDALWMRVRTGIRFAVDRNRTYLNWRFCDNPKKYRMWIIEHEDEVLGLLVTKTEHKFQKNFGYIAELIFDIDKPVIGYQLLNHAKQFFKSQNIGMITALSTGPEQVTRVYRRSGFHRLPKPLMPHGIFFCVKDRSNRNETDELIDPNNWFVSWADHDVV